MTQHVLAFDPGETTGIVAAELTGPRTYKYIEAWQVKWSERFSIKYLINALTSFPGSVIVCEDFHLYATQAQNQINSYFPSVKVIGIIETWANEYGISVFLQPASARVSTNIPDIDKSKLSSQKHARDAYQHMRYWVLTKGPKHYQDTIGSLDTAPLSTE